MASLKLPPRGQELWSLSSAAKVLGGIEGNLGEEPAQEAARRAGNSLLQDVLGAQHSRGFKRSPCSFVEGHQRVPQEHRVCPGDELQWLTFGENWSSTVDACPTSRASVSVVIRGMSRVGC